VREAGKALTLFKKRLFKIFPKPNDANVHIRKDGKAIWYDEMSEEIFDYWLDTIDDLRASFGDMKRGAVKTTKKKLRGE